jgi:hypothetical protein
VTKEAFTIIVRDDKLKRFPLAWDFAVIEYYKGAQYGYHKKGR